MKKIVLSLAMVSITALSMESHYVVNQHEIRNGDIEVDFRRSQQNLSERGVYQNRNASQGNSALRLHYIHPIGEFTTIGAASEFLNRNYSSDTNGQSQSVTGLGDIALDLKSGIVFEPFTFTYGGIANVSPGRAQAPYAQNDFAKAAGNNFSGTQSLGAFIGAESYIYNKVAVGTKLNSSIYAAQRIEENGDPNYTGNPAGAATRLEGFAEFPVFRHLDLGVLVGTGLSDNREQLGQIYSQYQFDHATAGTLTLSNQTMRVPFQRDSTDLTVGIRRAM